MKLSKVSMAGRSAPPGLPQQELMRIPNGSACYNMIPLAACRMIYLCAQVDGMPVNDPAMTICCYVVVGDCHVPLCGIASHMPAAHCRLIPVANQFFSAFPPPLTHQRPATSPIPPPSPPSPPSMPMPPPPSPQTKTIPPSVHTLQP